jgi:hypothetical protein
MERFTIGIADDILVDLNQRLDRTRWIDDRGDNGWKYGLSVPYMRALAACWRNSFDWRAQERKLNWFANYRVQLDDGLRLHYVQRLTSG